MSDGSEPDKVPSSIREFLAKVDLTDGRVRREPEPPPCPHGMGSAKSCVECMNEVGLGAAPRRTTGAARRWQDELDEATVALLVEFGKDIVRSGQNTPDSANDYRGYVAQALVLLTEGTAWADLDTNVRSGSRSFMRWAEGAHPATAAAQAALASAREVFARAEAR